MERFPSGQRGQTVNLLAQPSKVRILLSPLRNGLLRKRETLFFYYGKRFEWETVFTKRDLISNVRGATTAAVPNPVMFF